MSDFLQSQGSNPPADHHLGADQLSNLHGVQRCALTQVVARDEHDHALAYRRSLVSSDPTDETRIPAGSVESALQRAATEAQPGDRVVVMGSFHTVGPALAWLGVPL